MDKKRLIIDVTRPIYGGYSIGRYKGKVVMIKGAVLPGETVEAVDLKEKKDYISASAGEIIQASPDRIAPPCQYYGTCGGCHLQHAPYPLQVSLKEDILSDAMRRLAKREPDLAESIIAESPWNYRLRAQFKVSEGKIGFYRANSTDLIEIDHCPLMKEEINTCLAQGKALLRGVQAREMHLSCGNTVVGFIKMTGRAGRDCDRLASALIDAGLSGLMIERGDKELLRYEKPYITLDLEEMFYTTSAVSFIQSNWQLNRSLVRFIKETLGELDGKRVLDLYAGAGNFSLHFAPHADVTAVEESPFAIEDGRRNLRLNGIRNYTFIQSSAEEYQARDWFDVLILDPPRLGLTNRVIKTVLSLLPEQIVYISCNPATFSRDLKKLGMKYNIESIRMVDFFPQTFHIESLAFLRLR